MIGAVLYVSIDRGLHGLCHEWLMGPFYRVCGSIRCKSKAFRSLKIREYVQMKQKIVVVSCLSAALLSVAGCQPGAMQNRDVGAVTGGVLGALVGKEFGKGSGRVLSVAGAMVGSMLGGRVGEQMDEFNRMKMSCLENTKTGRVESWRDPDTGYVYSVKPIDKYTKKASVPILHHHYINGKTESGKGRACRNSQGQWVIQG